MITKIQCKARQGYFDDKRIKNAPQNGYFTKRLNCHLQKNVHIKNKRHTGAGYRRIIKRCITDTLALYHARIYNPFYTKKAFSTFSIVILLFYV